jgi:hypothetical protein
MRLHQEPIVFRGLGDAVQRPVQVGFCFFDLNKKTIIYQTRRNQASANDDRYCTPWL